MPTRETLAYAIVATVLALIVFSFLFNIMNTSVEKVESKPELQTGSKYADEGRKYTKHAWHVGLPLSVLVGGLLRLQMRSRGG